MPTPGAAGSIRLPKFEKLAFASALSVAATVIIAGALAYPGSIPLLPAATTTTPPLLRMYSAAAATVELLVTF